jgi:hypothetical protein
VIQIAVEDMQLQQTWFGRAVDRRNGRAHAGGSDGGGGPKSLTEVAAAV